MTERWRKKLGDLDKQGPSDDVFDLAKEGPRHTDQPHNAMRPSTRIATAVAAFAVFALAISVFAIPALRMQSTDAGSASTGLFPLWPSQTQDQLKQLQADADAGSASWALDPRLVSERFAHEVMGWSNASVSQQLATPCDVVWPGSYPGSSSSTGYDPGMINIPSSAPPVCGADAASGLQSGCADCTPGYTYPPFAPGSSTAPSGADGFETFLALPCGGALTQCAEFGAEQITVFQPLEQGTGHIWAVMEARSDSITLSTAATQTVRSGASIGATSQYQRGLTTLGYASCGSSGGSSDGRDTMVGFSIVLDTSLQASADCAGPQPGYVWAAQATIPLADGHGGLSIDPFGGGAQNVILGLTAVPVVMTFPDQEPQTPPPNGGSDGVPTTSPASSPPGDAWTTYTDPLGWTIDVPTDWQTRVLTGGGDTGAMFSNADMSVQIGLVPNPKVADDSSFPLDPNTLLTTVEGGEGGWFRGDGSEFMITVLSKSLPGPLPNAQATILDHMITSISFQPWSTGETRGDWTAVGKVLPAASAQWITVQGQRYIASYGPPRALLGPAPSCPSGGATYEIRQTGVAAITCGNATSAEWDFTTGAASPSNGAFGSADLDSHPAELSWDGQLLVPRLVGEMSPVPTVSPTP